jgi:hypothetical protein
MFNEGRLILEFIPVMPWQNDTAKAMEEIRAIYAKDSTKGDRLSRSVATAVIMEQIRSSAACLQKARTVPDLKARPLLTFAVEQMAGAFSNPSYAYLNAESIHRTGKPLLLHRSIKVSFETFMDNIIRSMDLNTERIGNAGLPPEVARQMTGSVLAGLIPIMTAPEFIDRYICTVLNRFPNNDINAPIREGFQRGQRRFHELYQAAQTALNPV